MDPLAASAASHPAPNDSAQTSPSPDAGSSGSGNLNNNDNQQNNPPSCLQQQQASGNSQMASVTSPAYGRNDARHEDDLLNSLVC